MAKLFFRYGCMNSGKSTDLLKVYHNYQELGRDAIILTSQTDTREKSMVKSRIAGLSEPAIAVGKDEPIYNLVRSRYRSEAYPDVALVDEAQFLSAKQVLGLVALVDCWDIPVIAYGLKNTFKGSLFEGSEALLTYADKIEEIKTLCAFCSRKATMHLLRQEGTYKTEGDDVFIGDTEFLSVCRKHYFSKLGKLDELEND